ncbi:hypothetical protein [Vampirovibrio chlorellavorus]|uniref:hypothetical protein n=1 Tax=Vampirovibrio chlorellavorus TaxID=758823 RepID=UPI0026EDAFAF|nr:hypothetical protein [Vampirovibrio chlorellavorus]
MLLNKNGDLPTSRHPQLVYTMSVHQPYPPQFSQFRTAYAPRQSASTMPPYRPGISSLPGHGYPGRRPAGLHAHNQNGNSSFYGYYSGYLYYLSPYQHPLVLQQASTAANNWVLDVIGKMPWHQIIPTWTEVIRMGMRSAQDQLPASLARWRARRPGEESLRNVTGQVMHGVGRWA